VDERHSNQYRLLASGIEPYSPGGDMKKRVLLLIAAVGLLSGCVVYDDPYRAGGARYGDQGHYSGYGDHGHYSGSYSGSNQGDRDRDGVPNSQDRRPNDPTRY
jgi:hypothetical protein